ncbi:type II toxin-antitoxin system RelB/DinJ family antitoxin [Bombilactobacillus folatiphilus]|uniref:Type II toxin-antitoxin system RelB/DinJ family antitoxin n=1 Tax=Bombilactobacillus folatiphilus TaxID=2923362 RepID=A0ABY4P820_9LACO|nr:type II toxin-antitoxin system RelB/DinJ family antitoxin [Bombilactobacillus folatiphilus]UQS81764.1 type II toxin-antitoxin system RelB/DinJ family antitoxin [Bombilactobacillus folatiphilus]
MAKIEVKIADNVKQKAQNILHTHGLTISDFMQMAMNRVVEEGLPQYYAFAENESLEQSLQEIVSELPNEEITSKTTVLEGIANLIEQNNNK